MAKDPEPQMCFGHCDGCGAKSRIFEYSDDAWICLKCYRTLVEAVIDVLQEGNDAAS